MGGRECGRERLYFTIWWGWGRVGEPGQKVEGDPGGIGIYTGTGQGKGCLRACWEEKLRPAPTETYLERWGWELGLEE